VSKLLFIPFSIAAGFAGGLVGKKAFDFAWGRVSPHEPPRPNEREVSLQELVAALALEGAIFRVSRGLAERASRVSYLRMTGSWPGEQEPEPS
jgi:hypothetical protein